MAPIIPQTGRAVLSVSVPLSQKMSCRLQCNMLQAPGNLLALHLQARTKCPWTDLTQNSTSNLILLKTVCCKKCKDTWQCSYQIWLQDNTGVLFGNLLRVLVHKEHWPSFFTVLWPQVTWSWDRYLTQVLRCFLFPFIFLLSTSRSNWPETWLI